MKRLIIGDIHGCWNEFQALLDKAGLRDGDEIIALGDFVDRGPDTPKVLDFIQSSPHARSLIGNHERKHVRAFKGELKPALSQVIARGQIGEVRYPDACAFMEDLPYFIELEEALLVHGFFEPGVAIGDQRMTVLAGTMSGGRYLYKHYQKPWYELYDGEKPLVCGHLNYLHNGKPLIYQDRVWCIDTGCCRGGNLTGLVLPDFQLVSVKAKTNYWAQAVQEFKASQGGHTHQ